MAVWIRDCGNWKNLEEAVTTGACRATDHTVEYMGDGEAAENLTGSKEGKKMPIYGISVREILKRTVIAEAESVEDAIQKVETAVEREEIILEVEDFDDREIVPSEYWKGGRIPDGEDVSCYCQLDGGYENE